MNKERPAGRGRMPSLPSSVALLVQRIDLHAARLAGHEQAEVRVVRDGAVVTAGQRPVLNRLVIAVAGKSHSRIFAIPQR